MLFKEIDKTTIILANCGKSRPRVRRVPTFLLRTWQRWVGLFFFVLVALIATLCLIVYQNTSRDYQARLDRANYIRSKIDVEQIQSSFMAIDSGLYQLNSFLNERGLSHFQIDENMGNLGGIPEDIDATEVASVGVFFEKELTSLLSDLKSLPLGKPYDGDITSKFGWRRSPFNRRIGENHTGIDFKGAIGDTICTTASGLVKESNYNSGYGHFIVVQHSDTLQTLYAHLSRRLVKVGDKVDTGQPIGLLGNTGRSKGAHLHYEVIHNCRKINPEPFLLQ
jgi:murein DD-endopeptidase MepM/ murein hydrolase activator NlpD